MLSLTRAAVNESEERGYRVHGYRDAIDESTGPAAADGGPRVFPHYRALRSHR